MSHWVRLWDDMPTDPKWRVIARRAGRPLSEVLAVFVFMMTNAANANERGTLENWNDEDVAAAMDMEPEHVGAIRTAMQGKTLDGEHLTGWDKRQPKREDGSADRAKQWRESKKEPKQTHANAAERNQPLDTIEQSRADIIEPDDIPSPLYDPAAADLDSIDQQELERRCVQATGWHSTTGISAIVDFVRAGADLEEVVLPMLRILAKEHRETNRKPPNVWAYAVKVLRDPTRRPARAGPLPALDFIEEGTTLFEQLMAGPKASFWRKVTVKHPETGKPGIYRKKEAA